MTSLQRSHTQTKLSVSSRGAVRGAHFADVPPSQAKYVTALSGSFIDFAIGIRGGYPSKLLPAKQTVIHHDRGQFSQPRPAGHQR
jgi:dTDP-4-dehydrorhamnose 3,5-epimerase-like enzyme